MAKNYVFAEKGLLSDDQLLKLAEEETFVDGLGKIIIAQSNFCISSEAVLKKADDIITLRELAYAWIQKGYESSVFQVGSFVKEGSLFEPYADYRRIWLRKSLSLENPEQLVNAHFYGGEYCISDFNTNQYLEQIGNQNYFILPNTRSIPTHRFGEDGCMNWAFGDLTQQTGQFLADAGIKRLNISMHNRKNEYIDKHLGPFINQLHMDGAYTKYRREPKEKFTLRGSGNFPIGRNNIRGVMHCNYTDKS